MSEKTAEEKLREALEGDTAGTSKAKSSSGPKGAIPKRQERDSFIEDFERKLNASPQQARARTASKPAQVQRAVTPAKKPTQQIKAKTQTQTLQAKPENKPATTPAKKVEAKKISKTQAKM
ncbi:MAG: hypothetical protein IJU15_06075, partial [Synergistaceae bacterium]|nr:hypothetical protein [Synergistaceae bacterium]